MNPRLTSLALAMSNQVVFSASEVFLPFSHIGGGAEQLFSQEKNLVTLEIEQWCEVARHGTARHAATRSVWLLLVCDHTVKITGVGVLMHVRWRRCVLGFRWRSGTGLLGIFFFNFLNTVPVKGCV